MWQIHSAVLEKRKAVNGQLFTGHSNEVSRQGLQAVLKSWSHTYMYILSGWGRGDIGWFWSVDLPGPFSDFSDREV